MVKSGKRWRPFLTAAVYSALTEPGAELSDKIIKPALAVECFHKASLIHDDIEDNDDLRYGDMTLHKQHGIPIALNIGDLLIGEGYRFIGEAPVSKESIVKMLLIASECHKTLSLGQGEELLAMKNMIQPLTFDEIKNIFQAKTSPAFEAALAIGAACAQADEEIFPILKRFSKALGMAYQIKDDLDDFIEIDDEISHLRFRCSLLLSVAYENGTPNEKQTLIDFLKNRVNSDECIRIISATKNMEKAHQLYEHYKNEARLFIFLSFTILLMCSCELGPRLGNIVNPPEKASSVISLHKIVKYPRAKILHRTIEGFDGIPISVNVNSFAHSKVIKKIELIERDSKITSYDLKIFFNRAGP